MEKLNDQITLYNADCMEVMKTFKDKQFDLAIVDPPYGISKAFTSTSRIAKYGQTESVNDWKPTKDYFQELFRVSKNQIIWGYNHLSDMLPSCKEFLFLVQASTSDFLCRWGTCMDIIQENCPLH